MCVLTNCECEDSFVKLGHYTLMKHNNGHKRIKIENAYKKHLRGKSHLFDYLRFVFLLGCVFVLLMPFLLEVLKTAFMTSFTLLLGVSQLMTNIDRKQKWERGNQQKGFAIALKD